MIRARTVLAGVLLGGCASPPAPSGPVPAPVDGAFTLFLIGDAGAPAQPREPVLVALERALAAAPATRYAIFLGDNVYYYGVPPAGAPSRAEAELRLRTQVDVLRRTQTRGLFVPGNHDWNKSGRDGLAAIRRQDSLVHAWGEGMVTFAPRNGCPGPLALDVAPELRVVALDTEWWLFPYGRPEGPGSSCETRSEAEVTAALDTALAGAGRRHAIVVAHHPLASGGEHGGHFTWKDHLFPLRKLNPSLWIPLPWLGSAYPGLRSEGMSDEDRRGARNVRMRAALEAVLRRRRPLAWASGHEHDLEVWRWYSARHLLVSGGGIYGREVDVRRERDTQFTSRAAGFMRLDFLADGRVRLGVLEAHADGTFREAYAAWLE